MRWRFDPHSGLVVPALDRIRNPAFTRERKRLYMPGIVRHRPRNFGASYSVFSMAMDSDTAALTDYSIRNIITSIAKGDQIRVSFPASSAAALTVDNASIGIRNTTYNMLTTDRKGATTPKELKFSGASGFAISAGATIVSDWLEFEWFSGDVLIVVTDIAATNGNIRKGAGNSRYYLAATNSYNSATPAGSWSTDAICDIPSAEGRAYQ